jgi:glycosyltransferase involved in cell wall biosynthesis
VTDALVSVIIPVYDMAGFLPAAIESVLAQTLPAHLVEVVVVDDGSHDDSADVAARYAPRVRCVRQANRGLPGARNTGIRASHAPFLQFLDADDRIMPEKLEASVAVLGRDEQAGLVYSGCTLVDEAGSPLPQHGWSRVEGDVLPQLLLGNLIHTHAAVVRRTLVERAGGFDETLTSVEDWDLWLRLGLDGARWRCVDRALAEYRVRDTGMHGNPGRMLENRLRVLEKVFADPRLPAALRPLDARAFRNAWVVAACDHYRIGRPDESAAALLEAMRLVPDTLADAAMLRQVCRLLLPIGYQRDGVMAARWRPLGSALRRMVGDAFAQPDIDPALARGAWRARLAAWRVSVQLARRSLTTTRRLAQTRS